MNNGRQTILCLYQDPGTFDDRKSSAASPMLPVHSTLKLWGEAYVRLADEAALRVRLEACAAKREECLVVMEGVRRGALEHISTLSVKPRVIVVTSETMKHDSEDHVATREVHHFLSMAQEHLATTALISAVKKWTSRDIFGIEKYLTYGTPVNFFAVNRSNERSYRHEVLNVPRVASVRVNTQGPGAGIGLHMVIRRVSGLVINMNAGVSTECIALFDVTRSPRWLNNGPKTFHFFNV